MAEVFEPAAPSRGVANRFPQLDGIAKRLVDRFDSGTYIGPCRNRKYGLSKRMQLIVG